MFHLSHKSCWKVPLVRSVAPGQSLRASRQHGAFRGYSTTPRPQKRSYFKFGLAIGLTGSVLYFTNDTVKHFVQTSERVGVVTVATIRCFSLYKDVLYKDFESGDERSDELARTHKKAAKITLKALETNGGIYIKLGQHISALTYLLPPEWTETMLPLQDRCPQSSMEEIERMFVSDLGRTIDDIFTEFDPNPVGVASLAQVHLATLRDTGEKVAVKVQHPSLQEFVPLDVYLTKTVFELMYKLFPEYPLTWLSEEMQNSIYVELDFTNEAENAQKTSRYFQDYLKVTALRIPEIVSAQRRILVMEYVGGSRLDNLQYLKDNNISTMEVSSCLSHIFNNMIFTPGVGLHCDPHGGNLAIRGIDKRKSHNGHNFEIILYDHGLYRDIPLQMKRDYSHFWLLVLDNDVPKMKEYAAKFAGIEGEQKFKIFASAITGRSPEMALNYDISKVRTNEEVESIQKQLHSERGVLEDLMEILSTMPRIVLLILKTNDLTRNLDENLNNPLGQERTFLILANYCARVVYDEAKEQISSSYNKYSIKKAILYVSVWWQYQKRMGTLYFYDTLMLIRNIRRNMM